MSMLLCQIPGRDYSRPVKSVRVFGTARQGTCLCKGTDPKNREVGWNSYCNLGPVPNMSTGALLRGLDVIFSFNDTIISEN